ncbi:MAG: hypothetical protein KDB18_13925, partial [Salinibacterium sp.]|nr:hypothetical protein [Salinibacterium sp.]
RSSSEIESGFTWKAPVSLVFGFSQTTNNKSERAFPGVLDDFRYTTLAGFRPNAMLPPCDFGRRSRGAELTATRPMLGESLDGSNPGFHLQPRGAFGRMDLDLRRPKVAGCHCTFDP